MALSLQTSHRRSCLEVLSSGIPRGYQKVGQDTALFRRLVLGWIEADFRVQIRILQHFSESTRKSFSREQILQISGKIANYFAENPPLVLARGA